MNKNIIVYCFGRTGSTNLCDSFVKDPSKNFINAAEIFCRGKSFTIKQKVKEDFTFLDCEYTNEKATFKHQYNTYLNFVNDNNKKMIMKMWAGWHTYYIEQDFYKSFLDNSHVIFLHRKNLLDQIISVKMTEFKDFKTLKAAKRIGYNKDYKLKLEFDIDHAAQMRLKQLRDFLDNIPNIDTLIISENIFNQPEYTNILNIEYGIDFKKMEPDNTSKDKKTIIENYAEIKTHIQRYGYDEQWNKLTESLQKHIDSGKIKKIIGNLDVHR